MSAFVKAKNAPFTDTSQTNKEKLIVLAGNPNVGKSTLFNSLTGLKQHTGNWSGKTVSVAFGKCSIKDETYIFADAPGCYSLKANSTEEYCAAEIIRNEKIDGIIVVCDACSLERNLDLVLQICEVCDNALVALNFMDTAKKRGLSIDVLKLSQLLKVPVVPVNARKKKDIPKIFDEIKTKNSQKSLKVRYSKPIENAIKIIEKSLSHPKVHISKRYLALRVLENDENIIKYIDEITGQDTLFIQNITKARQKALNYLERENISESDLKDIIAISILRAAHRIYKASSSVFKIDKKPYHIKTDRVLTGKVTGFLVMVLLLSLIFYITLKGANYPSKLLTSFLFSLEKYLINFLTEIKIPKKINEMLVYGGYRVLSWVISVMFPPMAIFFPLFTILEDVGYLPRIAFNLDRCFKKCNACGKQALTTCMGFGCNAAGVTGARIIDSPREKLIAILTNAFVPCNGRFPALIAVITIFFASSFPFAGVLSSLYLTFIIIASVGFSLLASKLLSSTLLRGIPSSFAIELPPYRKPQFGQIVLRSVLDRTIFVLGRAAAVAFPAGMVLYLMCNIFVDGTSLIGHIAAFFEPLGRLMGLDGVILTAFLFGIPANEIVLPVALMIYTSGSILTNIDDYNVIYQILSANGWTSITAICSLAFFVLHWPCSTTLMTVKKETGSLKWTFVSFALPTIFGVAVCIAINILFNIIL